MDESQRALVAARIATLAQGQRADRSIDLSSVTQQDAADMLNVSVPSVKRAREVLDAGAPQLVEAVERGDLSVSFAARVAELPEEDQQDIAMLPKQEAIEEYKRSSTVAKVSRIQSRPAAWRRAALKSSALVNEAVVVVT